LSKRNDNESAASIKESARPGRTLPFSCAETVSPCQSGFYIGSDHYTGQKELLTEKIGEITVDVGGGTATVGLYEDKFGRLVVYRTKRVPTFDAYDRLYDKRYWRWFYIVKDFESLEPTALVCCFEDEDNKDWFWHVYQNI
jgi:hypothetical protein